MVLLWIAFLSVLSLASSSFYFPSTRAPYYIPPVTRNVAAPEFTPLCSANSTRIYCTNDIEYPLIEIKRMIVTHFKTFLEMYADMMDQEKGDSVPHLSYFQKETYLCKSDVEYMRPLRAVNSKGKWRVIVNIPDSYYPFYQTARVETCRSGVEGSSCPLLPLCYDSSCVQKYLYHRFVVYAPEDQYFPFAVESFKLPAACACYIGQYANQFG